jgi:hypothetical protein
LAVEKWKRCREFIESYLSRIETMVSFLLEVYLPGVYAANRAREVEPLLRPELAALREHCDTMLQIRARVMGSNRPSVRSEFGGRIPAFVFPNDILHDDRWMQWSSAMTVKLGALAGRERPATCKTSRVSNK